MNQETEKILWLTGHILDREFSEKCMDGLDIVWSCDTGLRGEVGGQMKYHIIGEVEVEVAVTLELKLVCCGRGSSPS